MSSTVTPLLFFIIFFLFSKGSHTIYPAVQKLTAKLCIFFPHIAFYFLQNQEKKHKKADDCEVFNQTKGRTVLFFRWSLEKSIKVTKEKALCLVGGRRTKRTRYPIKEGNRCWWKSKVFDKIRKRFLGGRIGYVESISLSLSLFLSRWFLAFILPALIRFTSVLFLNSICMPWGEARLMGYYCLWKRWIRWSTNLC